MAGPLEDVDTQALRLLKEVAEWKWHPGVYGFVEKFAVEPLNQITREELVERGLTGSPAGEKRDAGLQWLRDRLGVQEK